MSPHRIGFVPRTDFLPECSVPWSRALAALSLPFSAMPISHFQELCRCLRREEFASPPMILLIKRLFARLLPQHGAIFMSPPRNCQGMLNFAAWTDCTVASASDGLAMCGWHT